MTKAKYLDKLHKQSKGKTHVDYIRCKSCGLPELMGPHGVSVARIVCTGHRCAISLNCNTPYCATVRDNVGLLCSNCKKKGFCNTCISNVGCAYCDRIICVNCAFISKGDFVICTEVCAKATAKRAKME